MNLSILRSLLALAGMAILGISSLGQGIVSLNNRTDTGDIRIFAFNGISGIGSVSYLGATAQLVLINEGAGDPSARFTPLHPTTRFQTNSPAASYFVHPVDVVVPGQPAGTQVLMELRVWLGSEWSAPLLYDVWGRSAPFAVTLGGTNSLGQVFPIPALEGMRSFVAFTLDPPPTAFFDFITRETNRTTLGLFTSSFAGPSRSWVLESSPDFNTWTPILTNPPNTAPVVLTNEDSGSLFFRLR